MTHVEDVRRAPTKRFLKKVNHMVCTSFLGLTRVGRVLVGSLALLFCGWLNAAVVVGQAAIHRSLHDTFNNFVITLPSDAFTSNGTFDQWNVFVNRPGSLGLLILNGPNATPTVVQSLIQTTTMGLNTFNLGSAISVSSGDYLGIWMGSNSKVEYDLVAGATTPFSANGAYASIPVVGTHLNTGSPPGLTSRNYSINVRFTEAASTVSEPGMFALVGLSLFGLAVTRRRSAR